MTYEAKQHTVATMRILTDEEEEKVPFSIPLDGETIDRLMRLSDICHADPRAVAASLLHDILKDDEAAHEPAAPTTSNRLIN